MIGQTKNPILAKAEQQFEAEFKAKAPAQIQPALQRVVQAGLLIMHSPDSHQMMLQQLEGEGSIAQKVGQGVAKLMSMLYTKSKGTMPVEAAIAGANILLCEAFDFVERAGMTKVTPEILAEAIKEMTALLMQLFGVTPERIAEARKAQSGQSEQPVPVKPQPTGILGKAMMGGA